MAVRMDDAGGVGAAGSVRVISRRHSAYRDHYALLFGWIFLIDAAMLAIAIARGYEALHAFAR